MIMLTRLDGNPVCVNEINVLWVEALPDTSVMLMGGTRILVRESVAEVKRQIDSRAAILVQTAAGQSSTTTAEQAAASGNP